MNVAYIVDSVRTAVGKAPNGTLHAMRPDDLGAEVVNGLLARTPQIAPELIEDVLMGCAFPEGEQGFNLGRVVAQRAGLPDAVPGYTVNRFCASGIQTIASAVQTIMAGQADILIAGGAESMSMIPMGGYQIAPNPDLMIDKPDVYCSMGLTAEHVAQDYHVSREDQDAFALRSHQKAMVANEAGLFIDEIIPVTVRSTQYGNGSLTTQLQRFEKDEGPRLDTSLEALANLSPVFRADGSVTAGNSSQRSDGAAAALIVSERVVQDLNLQPMGRLLGYATSGVKPALMGIGPMMAVPKVLIQAGLSLDQIELIELNEAFASQSLAVIRQLGLNETIVNVNGGAIALGHPLGCTGAKLTATLLHEMQRRSLRYGMVTLCVGGGMGVAAIFENLKR
jgi:acetyl-CoA acyltransferase